MKGNLIGALAFIVGLLMAGLIAILGAGSMAYYYPLLLGLLGLVVGLLNVSGKETVPFLIAAIAFLLSFDALASVLTSLALGWSAIPVFFQLMKVFIAPAIAVVALKTIYNLAKH